MEKLRIGIVGHGNLGKGAELALHASEDMQCAGIFTRRALSAVAPLYPENKVYTVSELANLENEIDILLLCGGSSADLPVQAPALAKNFNIVDSFDAHADIPAHFQRVNTAAQRGGKVAVISAGWDPGLFSLARCLFESVLPNGTSHTFWGRGVSQGHSEAIRRIEGVVDACQYTVPVMETLTKVGMGARDNFTPREMHQRECYVVVAEGAERATITRAITEMPEYFQPYNTKVTFVSEEELQNQHSGMPHGGLVVRTGESEGGPLQVAQFQLNLASNPHFTAGVMLAYARAAMRLARTGASGAFTALDIPPAYLSAKKHEGLLKDLV